jgi:hypothetical protein
MESKAKGGLQSSYFRRVTNNATTEMEKSALKEKTKVLFVAAAVKRQRFSI